MITMRLEHKKLTLWQSLILSDGLGFLYFYERLSHNYFEEDKDVVNWMEQISGTLWLNKYCKGEIIFKMTMTLDV